MEITEQHEMLMMTGRIIVPISDDNREFMVVIKPQQLLLFYFSEFTSKKNVNTPFHKAFALVSRSGPA